MARQKYYAVGISNKYSIFDSDADLSSDDEVILKESPTATETKEQQPRRGAENANHTKTSPNHIENRQAGGGNFRQGTLRNHRDDYGGRDRDDYGGRSRGGYRGGRGGYRGGRGGGYYGQNNNNNGSQENMMNGDHDDYKATRGNDMLPERSSRGRGRGRGNYGGRGREYDRHSGMGRRPDTKRNGNGGYNWGNDTGETARPMDKESRLQSTESANAEETGPDTENATVLNGNNTTQEPEVQQEERPEMLDFDAYKAQLAAKRTNLPTKKPGAEITTSKELEAQGYTRYQKETPVHAEESEEVEGHDSDGDRDTPKKTKMNVYEYIHNEGGRVRLFPHRGRGGRGGRSGGRDMRAPKYRDAPDIRDERAFPKLG